MSGMQKIIKCLAIAFAIFLTFNIISGIMYGISFICNLFDNDKNSVIEKLTDLEINSDTLLLDIDVSSSNIIIKEGDIFKAESNNKYISSRQDNNKLFITERKHNWFNDNNNNNNNLIIYIPADYVMDAVLIDNGAGKVDIEALSTKELYLNLGAGKVDINNLNVLEKTKIDGGAGELTINALDIHNLDLSMGIGKLSLTSKLLGNSKIDCGVGEMNLSLIGSLEDYEISLDKGVGNATIDGVDMKDNNTYGMGINEIDIDGGIGSIDITFESLRR